MSRTRAQSKQQQSTSRTPLLPQLVPVLESLPDLALETALDRVIEFLAAERFREVVLAGERFRGVVIVCVARSVPLFFHQSRRRVEDVLGRKQRAALLRNPHRAAISH